MKHSIKVILVLLIGLLFSCDKTSPESNHEALILEHTCGGTVVEFTSMDFGDEWVNHFDDFENHSNVALTVDAQDFEEGHVLAFSFKETNQLKGNLCAIGGLPETMIEMQNVRLKHIRLE